MFAALLSALPIIGPIVNGVVSIFKGKQDLSAKKDANDVEVIQARTTLLAALRDDIGIKVARDFAMWGPIAYVNLYIWDRIMDIKYPDLVWGVKTLDLPWESYMPIMAVYAFLFGLSYRGPRT